MTPNIAAFLAMISHSEGTDRAADPYRVCYGFAHTIVSLADHPAVTGEWVGERLPDAYCVSAGIAPPCHSSAAGRYQLTKPTWSRLKAKLGLTAFDGPAQDDAAVELLKEAGSFDLINAGRIGEAVAVEHGEWASLPGSKAGQPQTPLTALLAAYSGAGGALA